MLDIICLGRNIDDTLDEGTLDSICREAAEKKRSNICLDVESLVERVCASDREKLRLCHV